MIEKIFENYPDVIDVKQLCKMLDIGRNMAYRLLNDELIKSVKIGKTHKIPKLWVIKYLENAA